MRNNIVVPVDRALQSNNYFKSVLGDDAAAWHVREDHDFRPAVSAALWVQLGLAPLSAVVVVGVIASGEWDLRMGIVNGRTREIARGVDSLVLAAPMGVGFQNRFETSAEALVLIIAEMGEEE